MNTWKLDPAHTEITFKAKHLVIATVTGHFNQFDGTVESNDDTFENAKIHFEAEIASINTKNEQRDAHLKSADFFDAANYPKLTFESKSVRQTGENEYDIVGNMTIRGITKEVKLRAIHNGTVQGFGGVETAGFEITGKINRFDFGLQWNALTEVGGVVVGPEIRIDIAAELKKQPVEELVHA